MVGGFLDADGSPPFPDRNSRMRIRVDHSSTAKVKSGQKTK